MGFFYYWVGQTHETNTLTYINALLIVAPGRQMPMTGVGVSFLPVFTQQLIKKAKSKLSLETPTAVIGIHRP